MENNFNSIYKLCDEIKETYNEEAIQTAFNLLIKMFKNIINNPNESKFRQFKISNEAIKAKILSIKQTLEIVKEAGFTEFDKDNLAYKEIKTDALKKVVAILEIYEK